MRNGQICVWAPSKIVLDAVDGPSAKGADAVALASWFAATFDAREMLVIGEDGPVDAPVALRTVPASQVLL
jgi:dihydroneopterin aldolase